MKVEHSHRKLIDNLIKYLENKNPSSPLLKNVMHLRRGLCFGVSVCESISFPKQSAWWRNILDQVISWNGEQALTPELDSMMEKALSYILINFGSHESFNYLSDEKFFQYKFLQPGGLFEVSVNNKVEKIKGFALAGALFFDKLKLIKFLDTNQNLFNKDIIISSHQSKDCLLKYNGTKWIFTNNNETPPQEKTFDNTTALLDEIIPILGFDIQFRSNTPDQEIKFSGHEEILLNGGKLANFLNQNKHMFEMDIGLVSHRYASGIGHTCSLRYLDGQWFFFDINYNPPKPKEFKDVQSLCNEMMHQLGPELTFRVASLQHSEIKFNGYDELIKDKDNLTPNIIFDLCSSNPECVPEMIRRGQLTLAMLNQKSPKGYPLEAAIISGYAPAVEALLDAGVDAKVCEYPVYLAAARGASDVIESLSKRGFSVDEGFEADLGTPLIVACHNGYERCVLSLLKAGADVRIQNSSGETAFQAAVKNNHIGVVRILLAAGADPGHVVTKGDSALMIAANNGHSEVVKVLIEMKTDVNIKSQSNYSQDWTALFYAVDKEHKKVVKQLLDAKANPNHISKACQIPLNIALVRKNFAISDMLIEAGANINLLNTDGQSPLTKAIGDKNIPAIQYLFSKSVNVEATNQFGQTALMCALKTKDMRVVEEVLKHNPQIHVADSKGNTVLDYALFASLDIFKLIVERINFETDGDKVEAWLRKVKQTIPKNYNNYCHIALIFLQNKLDKHQTEKFDETEFKLVNSVLRLINREQIPDILFAQILNKIPEPYLSDFCKQPRDHSSSANPTKLSSCQMSFLKSLSSPQKITVSNGLQEERATAYIAIG